MFQINEDKNVILLPKVDAFICAVGVGHSAMYSKSLSLQVNA